MVADIAAFSRMMERDESSTFDAATEAARRGHSDLKVGEHARSPDVEATGDAAISAAFPRAAGRARARSTRATLRGGDAWDASIRRQIKDCALFVPIISANTQARDEGYFRLEWKLAVDRSHLMADDQAFLLPVVIDATLDANARVPEKFRDVQWTHLPERRDGERVCRARAATAVGRRCTPSARHARAMPATVPP